MATETREQFRERIGRIAAASDGVDFDQLNETLQDAVSDQAEAVYAQGLRDFASSHTTFYLAAIDDYTSPMTLEGAMARFAAERGINLEAHDESDG